MLLLLLYLCRFIPTMSACRGGGERRHSSPPPLPHIFSVANLAALGCVRICFLTCVAHKIWLI